MVTCSGSTDSSWILVSFNSLCTSMTPPPPPPPPPPPYLRSIDVRLSILPAVDRRRNRGRASICVSERVCLHPALLPQTELQASLCFLAEGTVTAVRVLTGGLQSLRTKDVPGANAENAFEKQGKISMRAPNPDSPYGLLVAHHEPEDKPTVIAYRSASPELCHGETTWDGVFVLPWIVTHAQSLAKSPVSSPLLSQEVASSLD
ncbi:unnamed protein product [Pleuronectes platessa]|uniref:Uncharacterized protein n=1 Tax=Pleuronectes platessa TaxID=8262 RepID=A0A9N7VIK9_PLEPL|nr:unnamed protein product [Pleuronectes platessa]